MDKPQLACLSQCEDWLDSMQQLVHQLVTENVQMRE